MTNSLRPGDRLETYEQYIELPRGSVVRFTTNPSYWYRKLGASRQDGPWYDARRGGRRTSAYDFSLGSNVVVHVGTDIEVGHLIRQNEEWDDLPVGSTVGYDHVTARLRKVENNRWVEIGVEGGAQYRAQDLGTNNYRVFAIPEVDGEGNPTVSPGEGIERFRYRLYQNLRAKVEVTGVNGARRALEALGLTNPHPQPWNGMTNSVAAERLLWPAGVVYRTGRPGSSDCDVFVKTGPDRQARNVLRNAGYGPFDNMTVTVVSGAGDPPEWWDRAATEEDLAAIKELVLRTWTVGLRFKRDNGWCGEFERTLESFGLTQPSEAEVRETERRMREERGERQSRGNLDSSQTRPTVINTAEARVLPVGTLLERSSALSDGTRSVYVRVDGPHTNPARTRRLAAEAGHTGHFAAAMVEVAQPGQTLRQPWSIPTEAIFNALPMGSIVSGEATTRTYSKREDGRYWCTCCLDRHVESFSWTGRAYLRQLGTVPAVPAAEPAAEHDLPLWTVGNRYTGAEVGAMPEGTLVRWQRTLSAEPGVFVYMVRCSDGEGEARTRQVMLDGHEFMGDYSTSDIELVALPNGLGSLEWAAGDDLLNRLPVGTVIRHRVSDNRYTREEGVWRRAGDGSRFTTRMGSPWRVVSVPPRTRVVVTAPAETTPVF